MTVTVDIPESITRSRVQELLRDLGLGNLSDLRSLTIDVTGIHADVLARHPEHGQHYLAGATRDQVATHTVTIALVDG